MGGHIIQKWYECSIDDQNHDRYRIEFFDRSLRMKIFMVEIIDWLINENHDRHYQNRVCILETQSLWSKERSVMSSEDLKDWKEEASIGDAECQMQRLKLSIFANNSMINQSDRDLDHKSSIRTTFEWYDLPYYLIHTQLVILVF